MQNKKIYIGQTTNKNVEKYIKNHFSNAIYIKDNRYFYNAIRKYGKNIFKWEILGSCNSKEELDEAEIACIEFFQSSNPIYGYNMTKGGGGVLGFKHTKESNQKNSKSHLGRKDSDETRLKKRLANLNKILSNEHRKKIGKSLEGKSVGMKNKKHSPESIKKMSDKKKNIPLTDEHIKNLSIAHMGQKSNKKNKTYVEIYGEEKAKEIIIRMVENKRKALINRRLNKKGVLYD